MKIVIPFLIFFFSAFISFCQTGTLRGHIYDAESGEPIAYASVQIINSKEGVISDEDGFFQLSAVPSGIQRVQVSYLGYLDTLLEINIISNKIKYQLIYLTRSTIELQTVDISASKERARTEIQIGQIQLSKENIKSPFALLTY